MKPLKYGKKALTQRDIERIAYQINKQENKDGLGLYERPEDEVAFAQQYAKEAKVDYASLG